MKTPNLALTLMALSVSLPSHAADWQYFGPYNPKTGVPTDLVNVAGALPPGLLDTIHKKLPESVDIRKTDPSLIADDSGSNVYLVEDAEVRVIFVYEGAGYQSALGMFNFDPNNPPALPAEASGRTIFENASTPPL